MSEPFEGWHEFTIECFKSDMLKLGIDVDRVYFSGFWNQGDGACFEGRVCNWDLFIPSALTINQGDPGLTKLVTYAKDNDWTFSVRHRGPYYHQYSTHYSVDFRFHYEASAQTTIEDARLHTYLENTFTEFFCSRMKSLYKELETAYDAILEEEDEYENQNQ